MEQEVNEIRCTCDALDTASPAHEVNCPMVTGRPISERWDRSDGQYEGELAELSMPEPVLARVLRTRCEDRRVVQAHLIDGSILIGIVSEVSEDGTVASIDSQSDDLWTFDVGAVCVLQTRRSKVEKA